MRFILPATALLLASTASFAADIAATSAITAATIYPGGATLTRTASFQAEAGTHTITVEDLPLEFDPASLRVTADDTLTILSVNHRIDRLPPRDDVKSPELEAAETAIEEIEARLRALDGEIAAEAARIQVAEKRIAFIDALMAREAPQMVEDVEFRRAGLETWASAIDTLANATEAALTARLDAEAAIDVFERDRAEIEEELAKAEQTRDALDLPPPPRSIATIEIASESPTDTDLRIAYRTHQAGWSPVYDMRLDQAESRVEITRHAQVAQWTGENWEDVTLTLSTARPSGAIAPPEMWEQIARIFPKAEQQRLSSSVQGLAMSDSAVMERRAEPALVEEGEAAAPVPGFTQLTQGLTVVYQLNEPVDIAGDQTRRQVRIDQQSFDVALTARTTPRFDATAYLTADLINSFGGPILPGQAAMFRDGTFMGTAQIPFTAAGDSADLPFGQLDEVLITHRTLEKEDGDFGLIGTTNRRVERFEITAKSLLATPITLVVTDQAPVSEQEDLEVNITARPRPQPVEEDGKRGLVTWNIPLQPGGETTIDFGYDITWPGDHAINIR